jgi:hypothetical protein
MLITHCSPVAARRPPPVRGLGFLFLLAGCEWELHLFRERAGRLAMVSWLVTVAVAVVTVGLLSAAGLVHAFVPVALE